MADVQIQFRADSSSARKEIQQLKSEIIDLRQHLGGTERSADATGKEVQQLGQQSRQAAMVVDVLGDESQRASQQIRELGGAASRVGRETQDMTRGFERARGGAQTFTRSLGGLRGIATGLGIGIAANEMLQFGRASVRASVQIDSATRALGALLGSAAEAEIQIRSIQDLADEPGLRFRQAVDGTVALRAIGVEAETTTRILKELANAAAFSGGAGEFERGLLGFRQLIQRGRLSQEELNQLTENISLASRVIREEFGTVLAEDIQKQLDATGQGIDDFVQRVLSGFERLERFPLDAPSVKLKNLSNSAFELSAAIGDRFLPILATGAEGLTRFFDGLTELISNTDAATESVENFREAIVEADTAIGREDAIQNRIRFLREYIAELKEAERNQGIFDRRGRARVGGEIASEQTELGRLERIQAGDPEVIRELTAEVKALDEELARIQQRQTERNDYILSLDERRRESARRSSEAFLEARAAEEDAVVKQIELRESELQRATEAAKGIAEAEREKIKATEDATAAAEAAASATTTQTDALTAQIQVARETRENLQNLSEAQSVLNDFWRVASGQVEDYSESIQTTIPAIVNLTEAENALTAAIDANLQTLQDATGDPLSDYIDSLTLTSVAADTAFGSINDVGKAVRDADFRRAAAELRDFDDAFSLSEVTIPRVRSEMERFTGTLPDAGRSIRDTTIQLQNLSQEAQSAAREAEFLNASFSALDAFDPRTPDLNAPSFDTTGFALRTGEELASQAIRTAGELRRIEEERVENLADLEREYSERIIEINEEKRRRLAEVEEQIEAERLRRLASIEQAFADAAAAEVAAREQAAARILRIEQKAAEDRERLREQLNDRLLELEQQRDARIQELNDGFIEREQDRQQEILAITERTAEARLDAEQRYADRVQEINNRLVEDVLEIQRGLQADIESLEAGFVQRQADRADEIVRITQEAADDRAAANQTFVETMQGIYNDLVEAWDDLEEGFTERQEDRAEERISIEQRAADARVAANQEYADTVAQISTDLVDEVRRIEAEIVDVQASAAADRIAIEQDAIDARTEANADYARELEALERDRGDAHADYAKRVAQISTDLVDEIRGIQDEITGIISDATENRLEIEQDGIDARADAHTDYADRIAEIEADTTAKLAENTRRITEIQQEAVDDRVAADEAYADRFQDIQNDLVERVVDIQSDLADRVVDIQSDLNDTLNDLRDEQLDAEQDRLDSLVELHKDTQQKLEDLERERTQTVEDLRREFQQDQLDAATQLDRDLEDADSEEDREAARKRYNRRIQDLTREFHRDTLELRREQSRERETIARQAAAREIQIAEEARARTSEIAQQQVDARAAAQEGIIAAESAAAEGITAAESAAGVAFAEAQANYVPALSAHEQALLAHAEALNSINQEESAGIAELEQERGEVLKASIDATATAAMTLSETLSAVTAAEQERLAELETQTAETIAGLQSQITAAEERTGLSFEAALANYTPAVDLNTQALNALTQTLDSISEAEVTAAQTLNTTLSAVTAAEQERLAELETETTGTLAGLNQRITDAEARTGLSFEAALANYTPAVDLNTQALQALTDTLKQAETERLSGLSDIATRGAADRATTTAAQQALETGAGVSIEEARANFVPALSSAAQATLTLNETMQALDTSLRQAITEIQSAGLVDRQAVDDAIQTAIADATAQQTALETQAGTTFADASLAFQPGLSDIAQAGVDRDTAISDIDQAEIEDIDAVNAQSIADRLETDAAITETRDQYIKARDTEIFKHNTAMLQLNTAEAADIKAVRATLDKNLVSIDDKLDTELAEIREAKIVFDTRIGELIDAINAEANQDVTALKSDTAAMRVELEAIATEQRNNAWKSAILSIANTGITIAGVAAGTALGNPVAGLAVGQAVGGLVEEAGNELFHYERTDRIARNIARQSAFRSSRPVPNYLPDANQIRNARDVSREIVAGVQEGLSQRERASFGGASEQASFPEELTATIQIQFPDGTVQELRDQMVRLDQQDR